MSSVKCFNTTCNNASFTGQETLPSPSVPQGLMLQFSLLLVVVGNLLVLFALRSYRRWTSPDVLVCSLSTADVLDSLVGLQTLTIMNYYLDAPWTRWVCETYLTLLYTFRFSSATTVTCMAAERALLVVYPIKHHTMVRTVRTKKAVLVIWLFCLLLSVLPLMGFGNTGYRAQDHKCLVQLYDFGYSYAVFIEVYGLVLSILTLASYVLITLSAKRFIKRQVSLGASQYKRQVGIGEREPPRLEKTRTGGVTAVKRLNKMMSVVVIVYYISWLPFLLNNLVSLIVGKKPNAKISVIAGLVSLLHGLVNPVLYGKMSQRYRRGYIQVLKTILTLCGGEKPNSLNRESVTVHVRTQQKQDPHHAADNFACVDRRNSESMVTRESVELQVQDNTSTITKDRTLEHEVKSVVDDIIIGVEKTMDKPC